MMEEVSFEEIFTIIRQRIKLIITWCILGLLLSSIYTFLVVTPQYESSSRIVVNQTQNTNQTITNLDIQTNLNLINTYQSIIKEPIILEDVIKKSNSELTVGQLRKKINIQIQDSSLVFGISILDKNPYVSAELANAISTTFEEKIGGILDVQSVTILSEAVPNIIPVSPNMVLNLAIGTILGSIVGIAMAFLNEVLDKRVKDSRIIDELGWVNLGSIIEMSMNEVKETRISKNSRINKSESSVSRRRV